MDLCEGQTVIVINDGYQIAPWATYHYFCDGKWWDWHKDREDYQAFTGQRITQEKEKNCKEPGLWRVQGNAGTGVSFDPNLIHYGSNSGFQVLNIAVLMGASRILLLGYDMKFGKDGRAHWFGDHPDKIRSNYASFLTNFSIAADQLKGKVEVINCSPDTALTCFRKASLASVLLSELDPV